MRVEAMAIPEIKLLLPRVFSDPRGYFLETWSGRALLSAGIDADFVQDNQSLSREPGVVRGLHFQLPPHAQGKLVRVLSGAILDVAVDIRAGSPTFGRHVARELTASGFEQLWIPAGFAHGFQTLEPETIVAYKVTADYAPAADRGLAFDDPDLGIAWPISAGKAILSEKDRKHPRLRDLPKCFTYAPRELVGA
ncbi:MAG: dTDP-4-dehydrorhamnose 3,5-epimerase [Hyphomicrobiaceae bacterium]|nr:MAG: dTDP-4-dehydrorhamnose 3,5-epimerase [Hyphomicrobiaceae bacterium]